LNIVGYLDRNRVS